MRERRARLPGASTRSDFFHPSYALRRLLPTRSEPLAHSALRRTLLSAAARGGGHGSSSSSS